MTTPGKLAGGSGLAIAFVGLCTGLGWGIACDSTDTGLATGYDGGTAGARSGGASGAGATGSGGTTGTGGVGGAGALGCPTATAQCSDGKDNDGDMKVDGADPECVGPCDNDEGSFATGIPGDNIDACKQDCFFDGNSGMGDDGCEWNLKCDAASPGASAAKACPYDMGFKNCPGTQSQRCIDSCRRLTPNGCDCFGCCAVPTPSGTRNVFLVASCTSALYGDPKACPTCTQQTSCINGCDKCEVCLGKPAPDPSCVLPPTGTGGMGGATGTGGAGGAGGYAGGCSPNTVYCGPGGVLTCPSGQYCITGCCVIP